MTAWEREQGPLPASLDRTSAYALALIRSWRPNVLIDTNAKFISLNAVTRAREVDPELALTITTLGTPKRFARALASDVILVACPSFKEPLRQARARSVIDFPHAFDDQILRHLQGATPHRPIVFSGSIGAPGQGARLRTLEALLEETPIECWVNEPRPALAVERRRGDLQYASQRLLARAARLPLWISGLSKILRSTGRLTGTLDAALASILDSRSSENASTVHDPLASRFPGRVHPPVYGLSMLRLLREAQVVFHRSIDNVGSCSGALRLYEATGVGAALMTDRSGDLGKYFEIDREVATYSTPEEAVAVARRLMSDAAHREEVARAGTERTLRDHTFASRAKLLNDVLRSELQI